MFWFPLPVAPPWYDVLTVYAAPVDAVHTPDTCQSLTIAPSARTVPPSPLRSGRSQMKFALRLCFTGMKTPSSLSASAWSERSEKQPSGLCCQRAPVLPFCDRSHASLKPNEKPLRKRRLNDVCTEWLVNQPRAAACVIALKPRKARI